MKAPSAPSERYSTDLYSIPGIAFDVEISDPAERIRAWLDAYKTPMSTGAEEGFDEALMREHLEVVSASVSGGRSFVTFLLKPGQRLSNRLGNIHGGALALIFDMCTTMCAAPLARKGFWQFGGVSRHLSVTYLRPVKASMEILVECEVLQMGARLATIRGKMTDKATGSLLCVGEHNKASVDFGKAKASI